MAESCSSPPKVFVSYSHDSSEHVNRVLGLCDRLRDEGIDADVDQYQLSPPEGWPRWMMQQIQASRFVLLVCTANYHRRFEGKEVSGQGLGATWEGAIVTQNLYERAGSNEKFIPVIFSVEDEIHIPQILRGATYYLLSSDQGYEALYRRLTNQPAVQKPALGQRLPLPPRLRMTKFPSEEAPESKLNPPAEEPNSAGGSSRQKGWVIPSVIVGSALLAMLAVLFSWISPQKPLALQRQRVALVPHLSGASSVSWSLDDAELLIVGAQNPKDDNLLFRYSLDGKIVDGVPNLPDSSIQVERPASAQRVGKGFVVKDEDNFVWLDELYQPYRSRDLLTESPDGDSLESAFQWLIVDRNIFAIGDVKRDETGVAPLVEDSGAGHWARGVVHLPLESPSSFDIIRVIATNASFSGLYLMGYPQLAKVAETAYFLEISDSPQIVRLSPEDYNTRGFSAYIKGFERVPDLSGVRGEEAYQLFEESSHVTGLYGSNDSLYVLSRCSTVPGKPTRWFLTRFDPLRERKLYTLSLPVTAPHLTIAPGGECWAILERGLAEPGKNKNLVSHKVSSLVLVPNREIAEANSPLLVDDSLPLCTLPAEWNENPPGWVFREP